MGGTLLHIVEIAHQIRQARRCGQVRQCGQARRLLLYHILNVESLRIRIIALEGARKATVDIEGVMVKESNFDLDFVPDGRASCKTVFPFVRPWANLGVQTKASPT